MTFPKVRVLGERESSGKPGKGLGYAQRELRPLRACCLWAKPENFRDSFHKALSLLAPPLQRLGLRLEGPPKRWQEPQACSLWS